MRTLSFASGNCKKTCVKMHFLVALNSFFEIIDLNQGEKYYLF